MAAQTAVIVTAHRRRIAVYLATQLKYIAFGNAGHTSGGVPITPLATATGLRSERLRKQGLVITNTGLSLVVTGTMESTELNGISVSEAAIFDATGNVIAIKTFRPIAKISGTRYEINFTLNF